MLRVQIVEMFSRGGGCQGCRQLDSFQGRGMSGMQIVRLQFPGEGDARVEDSQIVSWGGGCQGFRQIDRQIPREGDVRGVDSQIVSRGGGRQGCRQLDSFQGRRLGQGCLQIVSIVSRIQDIVFQGIMGGLVHRGLYSILCSFRDNRILEQSPSNGCLFFGSVEYNCSYNS